MEKMEKMENFNGKSSGKLSVDTENIFPIIRKWLYSDQDIFIRELVSNATDAIRKRQALLRLGEIQEEFQPEITITFLPEQKQLIFTDNGVGMSQAEIEKYINQIAFSGAVDFMQKYQGKDEAAKDIIGHFGLGFYSAFMLADQVEIDTLSCRPDTASVHWLSADGVEFSLTDSGRSEVGTSIILTLSSEGQSLVNEGYLRAALQKYCSFMPYPIKLTYPQVSVEAKESEEDNQTEDELAVVQINPKAPLWLKSPAQCTEEDYKTFYRETFHDFNEPLFWIHLNLDFPFNLKGILFFPKYEHQLQSLEGRIRLYNNQVFVADNIKEVIPDFLFLLKGCLDCPELPLNVSRSFLQQDEYVQKLSSHIIRKVADKLLDVFKNQRETYEKAWTDIATFVKYGMMREEKFYTKVETATLFATTDNRWLTLSDLGHKIYYSVQPQKHIHYIKRLTEQGETVISLTSEIDLPFMQFLEYKKPGLHFTSVDAEPENQASDAEENETFIKIFKTVQGDLDCSVVSLGEKELPALLVETEEGKRMKQMQEMMKRLNSDFTNQGNPVQGLKLLLNADHPLVKALPAKSEEETQELAAHIYDLARLSFGNLEGEDLYQFLQRSSRFLAAK